MSVTIDQKPITVNTKIIIAIITSTAIVVATFLNMNFSIMSKLNSIESEMKTSIKTLESENKIQDLKLENVRLEVERNKLAIEKLRDEYKNR